MSKAQGINWKKNHSYTTRRFVCHHDGCGLDAQSGLVLGKHFTEHPDHRTAEQREKWLANMADKKARDRVTQHNKDLEQDRITARKAQKAKASKKSKGSESAAERRDRLDKKNEAQNEWRMRRKAAGVERTDNKTRAVRKTQRERAPAKATGKNKTGQMRTLRNHSMKGSAHKFCTHCGGPRAGVFKFCAHCGYKLL